MEKVLVLTRDELNDMIENAAIKAVDRFISTSSANNANDAGDEFIRGYDELCSFLGISKSTAVRLKKSKAIPSIQRGRILYFNKAAVMKSFVRK